MEAEECFILKHKENNIQSDIRVYLKSLEKDIMMEVEDEGSQAS